MTVEYFNNLDEIDQLNQVFDYGSDVAQRFAEEHQITLFQLDSFYVEIYSSGNKMLCDIKAFDDTAGLDVYLQEININGLIRD
jgi:hypothetical protein